MRTIHFERQSGGSETFECEEFQFSPAGLEFLGRTKGKHNSGVPLYYVRYAVPAADIRWFEEVIDPDDHD